MFKVSQLASFFIAFLFLASTALAQSPNILLINLDDADYSTALIDLERHDNQYFPNIETMALQGINFQNFHANSPLCGPSRACLLRGQYACKTGIRVNTPGSINSRGFAGGMLEYKNRGYFNNDLSTWMHDLGYRTGFVGKYLHANVIDEVPPGWEDFYHYKGGKYYGTSRFINGTNSATGPDDYRTVVEADNVMSLLQKYFDESATDTRPFFLYWAPFCPHKEAANETKGMVEEQYKTLWPNVEMINDPDLNEADISDKPADFRNINEVTPAKLASFQEDFRDRLRAMKTFDDKLGQIRALLETLEFDDNTYIFLTSDNGYQLGHHRMVGKQMPTDRCSRVPFLAVGPTIEAGQTAQHLIGTIDIAPTLVTLAGGSPAALIDGQSFATLLDDPTQSAAESWRAAILIENWELKSIDGANNVKWGRATYNSARTFSDYYTEWGTGEKEFYDLTLDPFQLENNYSSLSQANKDELAGLLRLVKPDDADLISVGNSPRNRYQGATTTIKGVAEDNSGIASVKIVLIDQVTNEYWNGTEWTSDYARVDATIDSVGGTITEWSFDFNMALPETTRTYWYSSRAFDVDGNFSGVDSDWFEADNNLPTIEITSPRENQKVRRFPITIEGNASDNIGVESVTLTITDDDTGNTWDPVSSSWVASTVSFLANLETPSGTSTDWDYEFDPLNARNVTVVAQTTDVRGNQCANPATRSFRVRRRRR